MCWLGQVLHHSLSEGCDDFATLDTTLAKRARKVSKSSPPVVTIWKCF